MEGFLIIDWPDIQDIMNLEDFDKHAALIEPNYDMGIGSSTYLVDEDWYLSLDGNETD